MKKSTAGFTLLELVVGILCASLITGAAMSLMLMGLRNAQSLTDANTNLQNSRMILTMVEKLASEGIVDTIRVEDGSWSILNKDEDTILRYSYPDKTIYATNDSPLMENVTSSLTLSKAPMGGSLLGCTIACEDGVYETSAYSRLSTIGVEGMVLDKNDITITIAPTRPDAPFDPNDPDSPVEVVDPDELLSGNTVRDGRTALLSILSSQYGSTGQIIGFYPTVHFSQWYIGGYDANAKPDWNEDTPWCACFVSWGAAVIDKQADYLNTVPRFASVQNGWDNWPTERKYLPGARTPVPGDLIFFEWGNSNNRLDHVGVVFYADSEYVYTIEGNSNDKVAIQRYRANSSLIHGYAVLDWK